MYSQAAREIRQCQATRKDGERCRAYARWETTLCAMHTFKTRRFIKGHYYRHTHSPAKCECDAYWWPHRPGGGLCRWPDGPIDMCRTKPGTHSWPRLSGAWRTIELKLSGGFPRTSNYRRNLKLSRMLK